LDRANVLGVLKAGGWGVGGCWVFGASNILVGKGEKSFILNIFSRKKKNECQGGDKLSAFFAGY